MLYILILQNKYIKSCLAKAVSKCKALVQPSIDYFCESIQWNSHSFLYILQIVQQRHLAASFKTTSSSITKNLNSFFSRTIESFDKWFSPIDPQTACAHSKCKQCFMQISFRAKALGGGISDPKKSYSQMNTKK